MRLVPPEMHGMCLSGFGSSAPFGGDGNLTAPLCHVLYLSTHPPTHTPIHKQIGTHAHVLQPPTPPVRFHAITYCSIQST